MATDLFRRDHGNRPAHVEIEKKKKFHTLCLDCHSVTMSHGSPVKECFFCKSKKVRPEIDRR